MVMCSVLVLIPTNTDVVDVVHVVVVMVVTRRWGW